MLALKVHAYLPVQASSFQLLKIGKFAAMIILHFHRQPFKYILYIIYTAYIHIISLHGKKSLPMCGFIAQLVEHRTGIAEATDLNLVEALIFQTYSFQWLKIGKFTAMITLHFHLKNC